MDEQSIEPNPARGREPTRRRPSPGATCANGSRWSRRTGSSSASTSRSIPTRSSPPSPIWRRGARTPRRCCSRTSPATRRARACWSTCWAPARSATRSRSASIPTLSTAEMIAATPRRSCSGASSRCACRRRRRRSTRSCCAATRSTSRNFPAPKFWPGDGGRYIGTGDITLTRNPDTGRINVGCYRQMLHGPRRVGLYSSPGKHGGSTATPGGRAASRARWSPPTASIRCCSCWRRRCSASRNPSSTSPAA